MHCRSVERSLLALAAFHRNLSPNSLVALKTEVEVFMRQVEQLVVVVYPE